MVKKDLNDAYQGFAREVQKTRDALASIRKSAIQSPPKKPIEANKKEKTDPEFLASFMECLTLGVLVALWMIIFELIHNRSSPEPSSPSTGTNDCMSTVMKAGVVGQVASLLRNWQSDMVKWWANKRKERKEKKELKKEREEFWANIQIHNDKTVREIKARRRAAKKERVCEEA